MNEQQDAFADMAGMAALRKMGTGTMTRMECYQAIMWMIRRIPENDVWDALEQMTAGTRHAGLVAEKRADWEASRRRETGHSAGKQT